MSPKPLFGLLLAASALAPALAQTTPAPGGTPQDEYQRGYAATPAPGQAGINAGGAAGVQALNNQAAVAAQASADAAGSPAPADQARYDADRAAYMDALVRHDASVDRSNARYLHQQRAYADAMAVWRVQVQACKQGHRKACDMPAPDPASYY